MISKVMKKMSALMMAFVLILTSMPMQAFATTTPLLDGKLNVDYTSKSNKTITVANNTVELNATTTSSTSCGITSYSTNTAEATITNNSGSTGILKFSYTAGGHCEEALINGESVTGNATYEMPFQSGASIKVSVESKSGATGTATLILSGFSLEADSKKDVRFLQTNHGKITVNGEVVSGEKTVSATFDEGIQVKAEPDSGYQFLGWINQDDEILSNVADTTLNPTANGTVHALFAEINGQAYYGVGLKVFGDLERAIVYATNSEFKTIIPIMDGFVPAGNYTIPANVTLLIPFDEAGTCYKTNPETAAAATYQQPWPYRQLTLADGANLTVLGDLSVSAKHISGVTNAYGPSNSGAPTGPCGFLHLMEGSTVTIGDENKNPGNLYAWGFITGEGEILAKPAAKVYENLQITDWRGGTQSTSMKNRVFPFTQYYVQNIEAPITFEAGATETVRATVEISIVGPTSASLTFVGSNNALFNLSSGTMSKSYDAQTDRLNIDIDGNAELRDISIKVTATIETKNYDLAIPSNMSINAHSGTTNIKQSLALLPGSAVTVDEGATINVAAKINNTSTPCAVYFYDSAEWEAGFTYPIKKVVPVLYAPTPHPDRASAGLESVKVDVNGDLNIEGAVYTTNSGANIISSGGTGKVHFASAAPANTSTKQLVQQATGSYAAGQYVDVGVTSAKLKNADGSYTETAGSSAGTSFAYKDGVWKSKVTASYNANGGEGAVEAQNVSIADVIAGNNKITLRDNLFTRVGHDFIKWNTKADGNGTSYDAGAEITLTDDITLFAQWAAIPFTVHFDANGGTEATPESITKEYGTSIGELPTTSKVGHSFAGWFTEKTGGSQITSDSKIPAGGATYYAQWTTNTYEATFDANGGEVATKTIEKLYEEALGELPVPTRAGYTFDGWFTEKTGGEAVTPATTMPVDGATYYAHWTPIKYTAIFNANGGEVAVDRIEADYETALGELPVPTRVGYTFDGWFTEKVGGKEVTSATTMPLEGATYYAHWTINQYTITFETDGGSEVAPITQDYNSVVEAPTAPTKTGYTFAGWDVDVPTTMPATDMTITANWTANEYTLSYDANGGEGAPEDQTWTYADEQDIIVSSVTPERTGYTFLGWSEDKNAEEATYRADAENVISSTQWADNTKLYAVWSVNQYTITFDTVDGTEIEPITQDYGTDVTAPADPEREGYTFAGWDVNVPTTMPAENMTITAQWTINQYTITYDPGNNGEKEVITLDYGAVIPEKELDDTESHTFGGWLPTLPTTMPAEDLEVQANWVEKKLVTLTFNTMGGSTVEPLTWYVGAKLNAPANPEKEGHTFAGWNPEIPALDPRIPENDTEYVAQWTVNSYKITFDSDEGTPVEEMTVPYGTEIDAPVPVKPGYTFVEWSGLPETMPAKDLEVKAIWKENQRVTVTFKDHKGHTIDEFTDLHGKPFAYTEEPTRLGYSFTGWDKDIPEIYPEADMTLTAQWQINQYKITFNTDGGSEVAAIEQDYGTAITAPAEPTKEGYTFFAWYDVDDEEYVNIPKTMPARDMNLVAKWDVNTYTITFNTDGGSKVSPIIQEFGTEITAPKAPTKVGYSFDGWDVDIPETMPAGNMTITAKWKVNQYTISFETGEGGTQIEAITQDYGTEITAPADPTREGYTFDGWDVEIPETMPAENMTVTAKWDVNKYTITFDTDGGDTVRPITQDYGTDITAPAAPEKEGYTFVGWEPAVPETMPAEDLTVTAQWKVNQYTISFDTGEGGTKIDPITQDFGTAIEKPEDPTREGYTFHKWDKAVPATMPAGDMVITAKWNVNEYIITFDPANGDEPVKMTQDYGTAITAPADPTREGYSFTGWDVEVPSTMPAEDITITAQWTINQYTMTFDTANGDEPIVMTQDYGTEIVAPAEPTREGYTFAGWDAEIPETMPAENVTITAQWTINQYTITFDTAGGSDVDSITQDYGTEVKAPADPTREGYTFTGWDTEIPETMPAEDMTITANWSVNAYTAIFDANGGTDAEPGSITKDYDEALGELPETTRTGYTFNGWFTAAEEGKEITADTKMPVGGATYYAQWTINKHTITFDCANGTEPVEITKNYGTEVTVLEEPEKEGHTFTGWNTKADGTGNAYEPGDKVELTDDVKLFAQWKINQYTITFDANGGSKVDSITQDYGTEVTAPENPTRKGYTFAGWDGDIPETMPASDLTITAKWNINQYTVTFDDTNGTGTTETITQDYDTDVTVLEAPVREGYTFKTWNTEADGSGKDYKPGKSLRLEDNDVTLYAQWQINQYTITFDTDGGNDIDPITQDYGTEVKAPKEPTKYGYIFAGWEPAVPETMPAKDLEIKAQWIEMQKITVTFKDHDGTTIGAATGIDGEKIPVPADPTREGYTFAGWKPEVPEYYPEADATYTAQWTVNEYTVTFDGNDGSEADPKTITKDYGEELGKLPTTAREGYTFKGWFTEKTGGTKVTEETTMPADNATYYAQWAINTYIIDFDTVGGTPVEQIAQEFGTAITEPAAPTKEGHTFAGWNVPVPETMPAGNLTIIAQWLVNQYTIIFNTDGGNEIDPITQDYGTAIAAPENPTKKGYSFAGWDGELPVTMPAKNTTLKAEWMINQYTITFDTAGGSEINPITQDYGTEVKAPADPTREEYAFAGWDVEIPETMPADNMTITAKWDYTYTGWKTTDEGTTYFENGKQPYKAEWVTIDDISYYFDENGYLAKGATETEDGIYIFDETTGTVVEEEGIYETDGDIYLIEEGKVVENAGLVKIGDDYYYFGEDHKAVRDVEIQLDDTNDLLPLGIYVFGEDGKLLNAPLKITEDMVTLEQESVVYDGTEQTPTVVVDGFGDGAYEVTYQDNLHVGTATVTVTGVNGCFGTVTMHFEITKAKNSWTEKLTIEGWTEGETPEEPYAEAEFGEVVYKYFADARCTEEIDVPDAAGKYYVKAFVEDTEDYAGLESKAVKFIIEAEAEELEDVEGKAEDSPTTGDENQLTLWLGLAMASMMGALTAYRRRRDEM